MSKNSVLSVFEIVGNPVCVAFSDGQKVHDRVAAALKKGQGVTLSFRNNTVLTPAFLNVAIGQLYGAFSEGKIRSLLKVQDMQPEDMALLKRVIDTAKLYFQDIHGFRLAAGSLGETHEIRIIEEPGKQ